MANEILINEASGANQQRLDAREVDYSGTLRKQQLAIVADFAGQGVGASTESEATGNGTVIAILKRLRTLLGAVLSVKPLVAGTATLANVNDSAGSVTLQASNANRLGWSCFNDSTQALFIKFGATASATSFTTRVVAMAYYEMPQPIYTGVIDGIWAADGSGAARVTELT